MPLMNSFQKFRYIALLSAGALYATTATAGPPILFDGFTVNSGDITPTAGSCADPDGAGPITVVCDTVTDPSYIADDGMLQRRVTISGVNAAIDGTYIQFVLTDPGVTGDPTANPFSAGRDNLDFTNEDFIKMNSRVGGIASKQTLVESDFVTATLENRFFNETNYEFGEWANNNATIYPWVNIVQEISQVDYSVDPLNPRQTINMRAEITSNGAGYVNDNKVELSQEVDLYDPNAPTLGGGAQGFKYVKAVGVYQNSVNAFDPLLPGGTNGGTVTWNNAEEVRALWIGQVLDQASDSGGPQTFGLTQYSADTFPPPFFLPQTLTSTLVSFSSTAAVNWNLLNLSIFGPVPTLPIMPMTVAPTFAASAPDPIAGTIPAGSAPVGTTTPVPLPVPYYAWTVSGGVFTVDPCPVGAVCGPAIVNEGGIYQRQVTITLTGFTYFQTIITDENATGDPNAAPFALAGLGFKSENFVQMNSINQGIASILDIEDQNLAFQSVDPGTGVPLPSDAGQFGYRTELKTGWANGGPLDNRVAIDQRILVAEDVAYINTSSFDETFRMRVGLTQADKRIDMSSRVGTRTNSGSIFNSPIFFATSIVTGAFQGTTRTGTLFPTSGAANIDWNPYEAVQATWLAGEYTVAPTVSFPQLNSLSYTNLTTGQRMASTSVDNGTPVTPESWGPLPATPLGNPFTQPPPAYSTSYTPVVDPFL